MQEVDHHDLPFPLAVGERTELLFRRDDCHAVSLPGLRLLLLVMKQALEQGAHDAGGRDP